MILAVLHKYSTPDDVLRFAASRGDRSWTYIILGRTGLTGKTYLCNLLRLNWYNAFEISEVVNDLVDYRDDENHYLIDYSNKQVTIVLNRPLSREGF